MTSSSMHFFRAKKLWTALLCLSTTTTNTAVLVVGLRFLVMVFGGCADGESDSLELSRSRALALSPALPHSPATRCPDSCEDLFSKLKDEPDGTGKFQSVGVQLRGEPKSGTGMSQEWAWGALAQTCVYLRRLYGETSCRIATEQQGKIRRGTSHSIVFEPRSAQAGEEAPCTCDTVDRVQFSFSAVAKHRLPVDNHCVWAHRAGTADPHSAACKSPDGRPVKSRVELWKCVEDNDCPVNDRRLQLAVIRDPRAVTVSAYFMHVRLQSVDGMKAAGYLDAYFRTFLKTACMWMSIRYFLFTELLANQSLVLHYEDAVADPVEWHRRYLDFVGVRLPPAQVEEAARVASEGGSILGFHSKGLDEHPGAKSQGESRSFRDELSNSSLSFMDDVLRTWLPDVLLEKYSVLP